MILIISCIIVLSFTSYAVGRLAPQINAWEKHELYLAVLRQLRVDYIPSIRPQTPGGITRRRGVTTHGDSQ